MLFVFNCTIPVSNVANALSMSKHKPTVGDRKNDRCNSQWTVNALHGIPPIVFIVCGAAIRFDDFVADSFCFCAFCCISHEVKLRRQLASLARYKSLKNSERVYHHIVHWTVSTARMNMQWKMNESYDTNVANLWMFDAPIEFLLCITTLRSSSFERRKYSLHRDTMRKKERER